MHGHGSQSIATYKPEQLELRDLFCSPPPVFFMTPVTNYMLLYSTLLCKKITRAPGGHKKFMLTKLGGRNKIDPNYDMSNVVKLNAQSCRVLPFSTNKISIIWHVN